MRQPSVGEARHDHLASAPPGEKLQQHSDADAGIRQCNAMPGIVECGEPAFELLNQRSIISQAAQLEHGPQRPEELLDIGRRQLADWPRAFEQGRSTEYGQRVDRSLHLNDAPLIARLGVSPTMGAAARHIFCLAPRPRHVIHSGPTRRMERAAVPNSPSSCYVHIGIPRTGSTAIEKFLYENRQILLDRGILYPEVNLRGYGHHDLAYLLSGGYPEWAIPQPRNLDDLATDLCHASAAHSGDILISSENFYLFPAIVRLQELLTKTGASSGRRVVIIVYVRRQDEAQESWYSQTVKAQGETCKIDESIDRWRYLWDYRARLAEWAAAFGAANLVVRPYETTQFRGGSLITDFLACIGVDPTGMDLPTKKKKTRG
jgi:hypothetical protein